MRHVCLIVAIDKLNKVFFQRFNLHKKTMKILSDHHTPGQNFSTNMNHSGCSAAR